MSVVSDVPDQFLKSFMEEIEAFNNAQPLPTTPHQQTPQQPNQDTTTTTQKKRKRAASLVKTGSNRKRPTSLVKAERKKPGWVPKPPADCPVVSWTDNRKVFTVQNPANSGQVLLKMQLYDNSEMVYMCGLYLEKASAECASVMDTIDKLENMWVDKESGIPKIEGLTQTVAPNHNDCATPRKRSADPRRKRTSVAKR